MEGVAIHAAAVLIGRGKIFKAAAVIMPSVPSAPRKRCLR